MTTTSEKLTVLTEFYKNTDGVNAAIRSRMSTSPKIRYVDAIESLYQDVIQSRKAEAELLQPTKDPRMRVALHASLDGLLYDITDPMGPVQVEHSADGHTLWVNIGAVCVLRVNRIQSLEIQP